MTKLELLNVFLNDRLTAAADDIFTAIKNTVVEYESEILRSKEENERLKRLLNIAVQRLLLYSEPYSIQHREDGQSSETQPCRDEWRPPLGQERPQCQPPSSSSSSSPPQIKEKLEPEFISNECAPEITHPSTLSGENRVQVEHPLRVLPTQALWDRESGMLSPEHIKVESDGEEYGKHSPLLPSPVCSLSLAGYSSTNTNTGGHGDPTQNTETVPGRRQKQQVNITTRWDGKKSSQTLRGKRATYIRPLPPWSSSPHHQSAPSGQKCHCCRECGKRFSFACQLEVHMRWHTKEKPYGCAVCRKSFTTVSMLKRHHRIHTGEKPFRCHVCGKCFNQSAHLNTHFRLHAGGDRWRREPLSK